MGGTGSGPRRQSARLIELKGTGDPSRQRRRKARAPQVQRGSPVMPSYLSPGARSAWKSYAAMALAAGVLTTADGTVLGLLAEAHADYLALREQTPVNLKQVGASERRLLTLLGRFGFTPADRTRVELAPVDDDSDDTADAWDAFKNAP